MKGRNGGRSGGGGGGGLKLSAELVNNIPAAPNACFSLSDKFLYLFVYLFSYVKSHNDYEIFSYPGRFATRTVEPLLSFTTRTLNTLT